MTYNVFGGTLSLTQSINHERRVKRSGASRKPGGAKQSGEPAWQKRMERERRAGGQ